MNSASLVPFPSYEVLTQISNDDLLFCLKAWESFMRGYLQMTNNEFQKDIETNAALQQFLATYMSGMRHSLDNYNYSTVKNNGILRKYTFLVVHRILCDEKVRISSLCECNFLGDLSRVYQKSRSLELLLQQVWHTKRSIVEPSLRTAKKTLTQSLSSSQWTPQNEEFCRDRLIPLIHALPAAGSFFVVGSDFLDALTAAYPLIKPNPKPEILLLAYICLISPLKEKKPNYSLCFDHLYGLRAGAESTAATEGSTILLSDLVSETPLLKNIQRLVTGPDAGRARDLVLSLEKYKRPSTRRPKRVKPLKSSKGKARAAADQNHDLRNNVHFHRMGLITQVQDLFPDLGSAYVAKLLDEYSDDVETVTAHLLDNSLPAYLQHIDRTENLDATISGDSHENPDLAPRSTPPPFIPTRRNIFDDDEFDRLAVDSSRLHFGRRSEDVSADQMLSDRTKAPNKAAILSALAAFDSDDDERDDTYDLEDVGGTVDSARPGVEDVDTDKDDTADKNEQALYNIFKTSPEVFQRDAATRRGKARLDLKNATGMTDESIEGWAIMVGRDPRRLRRLDAKYSNFGGQQRELKSTAWRMPAESGTEDSEASGTEGGQRGNFGRGRARGAPGRGRGGAVGGPSNDHSTQVARDRKEANKGSRANHNRRDQRARKMARGGFPG